MKFLKRFWPIGCIIFVWLIFSTPYFFKGLVPFPSKYLVTFFPPWNAIYGMPVKNNAMPDVITQIYPWKKLTIESWKNGEIPLWNPYSFSGTTHLGNYQTAVFSPFNVLFLILPEIDAWSVLVLLQPLLAGLFAYVFLRSLARSRSGSLVGSIAFMFCGFIVVWMAYGTLGYSALFLPFILWAMRRNKGLLVSFGLAFSFLSGHFQISIYVAVLSLAYALFLGWKKHIVFWFAGILLAMPQIFPAYETYSNAVRSVSFAKGEIIPWQYLLTFVAPDFFGNPVTRNDWFGHYAEWAGFVGVVPLMLAFSSLTRKKIKEEMFFLWAAVIALLLALPTPLSDVLFALRLPVVSTSAAARIIILVSFSLSVLAAYGFDAIVLQWKKGDRKSMVILSLGIALFLFVSWVTLIFFKPLPIDKLIVAKRNFILPSVFLILSTVLLWSGFIVKDRLRTGIILLLLALTSFDSLRFAGKWMPFDERQYVYPQLPVIRFLHEHVGNDRVFGNFGNELATTFGIPSIEGYDALYQRRYGEFVTTFSQGKVEDLARSVVLVNKAGEFTEDMLALLGVRYILHRTSDGRNVWAYSVWNYPHYTSIYKDDSFEVFENTKVFPRAFLASSYQIAKNNDEILTLLYKPNLDRRSTLIVEEKPELELAQGEGEANIIEYRPTKVIIRVTTNAPKLLFLSDSYDPGWHATVDGISRKILRADYDFRAVAVPAGVHTVIFSYQPESLRIGLLVAGLSALILMLGGLRRLRI